MINGLKRLALGTACLMQAGCALDEAERQRLLQQHPPWYAEGSIVLKLQTEPLLNAWQGMPNAVTLLILQSKDKQTLMQLIDSESTLRGLFSHAAMPEGVISVDRYTAMPSQQTTLHLNRVENSRYIAIIAGYYPMPTRSQAALFAIPISVHRSLLSWKVEVSALRVATQWGEHALVKIEGADNLLTERVVKPEDKS